MRRLYAAAVIAGQIASLSICIGVALTSCSQPPTSCTVSTFTGYAAKYQLVEGDCPPVPGDIIGLAAYNAAKQDQYGNTVPNLDAISLAIRTETLGGFAAHALEEGVTDPNPENKPHVFGPFVQPLPVNGICTADFSDSTARLEIPAVPPLDDEDPEDPDDDVEQDAVTMSEAWSDVQVYVTAANLGTQMRGRLTVTDDIAGCTATYDVLAVYPAVFCEDILPSEDAPVDIAVIDDEEGEDLTVRVVTATPHGLADGDLIEIADVDDDELSYDGTYSVLTVVDATTFITAEQDPFDGDDPDPAGTDVGTVQKLVSSANDLYCKATATPEAGIPVGSGISPDFPVKCDPDLLVCVLDASPSEATLPVCVEGGCG